MVFIDIACISDILFVEQSVEKIADTEERGDEYFVSEVDVFVFGYKMCGCKVVIEDDIFGHFLGMKWMFIKVV